MVRIPHATAVGNSSRCSTHAAQGVTRMTNIRACCVNKRGGGRGGGIQLDTDPHEPGHGTKQKAQENGLGVVCCRSVDGVHEALVIAASKSKEVRHGNCKKVTVREVLGHETYS